MWGGRSRDEGEGEEKKMCTILGMPATYLTTLCSVIKTWLQIGAQRGEVAYNGLRHCAQTIVREEGFKAFFSKATKLSGLVVWNLGLKVASVFG
jgi:hypothetical protein